MVKIVRKRLTKREKIFSQLCAIKWSSSCKQKTQRLGAVCGFQVNKSKASIDIDILLTIQLEFFSFCCARFVVAVVVGVPIPLPARKIKMCARVDNSEHK